MKFLYDRKQFDVARKKEARRLEGLGTVCFEENIWFRKIFSRKIYCSRNCFTDFKSVKHVPKKKCFLLTKENAFQEFHFL